MTKIHTRVRDLGIGLAAAAAAASAWAVKDLPGGPAVNQLDVHEPVTRIAADIRDLHYGIMIVCLVIFVAVFGVMFYSILKHRKSLGAKSANFHESVTVEIAWTIVPFIIVIGMGVAATKTVVAQKDTTSADLTIKATGYQWKWGYDYLKGEGEGIAFLSTLDNAQREMSDSGSPPQTDDYLLKVDNPLIVPVDRKIRVITTANDVIHAWMVPSLGVKQDALPGFVRDTWFRATKTGDYYGQCAELCGKEHAYMPIHVKVVSQDEYAKWVEGEMKKLAAKADDPNKVWELAESVARGAKLYDTNCKVCHGASGEGGVGKKLDGSPNVLGPQAAQMELLLKGKGAMPPWTQLSDTDLAALMTFTRNQWSNKTGEVIQPKDFKAGRAGDYPKGGATSSAAPAAGGDTAAAAAPAAAGGLPAQVFFETDSAALSDKAQAVLKDVAAFLKGNGSAKVTLSGYVDSTGSADHNAELAKNRAMAVRDALQAAGAGEAQIALKKPEVITGGDSAAARRVDISLAS